MKGHGKTSRRNFLKSTTAGAAGLAIAGSGVKKAEGAWPSSGTMEINPEVPNLRVVCCHDESMIPDGQVETSFQAQNEAIDKDKLALNMDRMAIALTGKTTAQEAWDTIFQFPSKPRNEVKVAVKVNCINSSNMPRIAIVKKVCDELTARDVEPENITVYDGCSGAHGNSKYTYYTESNRDLTGISVLDYRNGTDDGDWSSETTVQIPDGLDDHQCMTTVTDSDILINCGVNKGHGTNRGGATLCMKNHFGTFNPKPDSNHMGNAFMFAANKSNAILGGTPVRQQLCIVDSLWSRNTGPGDVPTDAPARILMGTFAPAIDWATCKKVRNEILEYSRSMNATALSAQENFAREFNYSVNDFENMDYIELQEAQVLSYPNGKKQSRNSYPLEVKIARGSSSTALATFNFSLKPENIRISIYDLTGALIYKQNAYAVDRGRNIVLWYGKDSSGKPVAAGKYVMHAETYHESQTEHFVLK
ncbi:MAG: DUF362 domain-containing protein [Chitinivibrionales bacterium]|nr:DUF362 domain-containing protein [Chitinivibrionales bacterium]